jgi:hypothetical protein
LPSSSLKPGFLAKRYMSTTHVRASANTQTHDALLAQFSQWIPPLEGNGR